jgi:mono/diheme cytochrome c family protein
MSYRFKFFVLLILIVCSASSCFEEENNHVPKNNPNEVFFRQNCSLCHGPKAEGKQIGDKYAPNLRSEKIMSDSDQRLFEQISNGGGGMPAYKHQLTEDQIREMVRYVRQEIQGRK